MADTPLNGPSGQDGEPEAGGVSGNGQDSGADAGPDSASDGTREALRQEYERLRDRVRELERQLAEFDYNVPPTTRPALEKTLARLLEKVTMIVRAEKCCVMVYNPETNELEAQEPAIGLTPEQIRSFRVRANEGVSGLVFREGQPIIMQEAVTDDRAVAELVALLGVRNGATVPLVHERKDDDVVVEERTIGVLHVFNKRRDRKFMREDLRILRLMARSAAAVISEARLFIELRERADTLEKTYESLPAGIIMVGTDGVVRLMNRAARQLLTDGATDDPLGLAYQDVIKSEEMRKLVGNTMVDQQELESELSIGETGRVHRAQTAIVWDGDSFAGVVAICNDVTELRNLEKMKSAFVTTVSHELRTPLTSIQGFARTLIEDEEDTYPLDARREFLGIIDKECRKLNRLVDDLQKVARIDEGHGLDLTISRVDMAELLRGLVSSYQAYSADHQIALDMTEEFEQAPILSDEDKIDQVVSNLLSNAIKYSPPHTEVRVRGEAQNGGLCVTVADEGRGIPQDQIDRVFDRFYRGEGEHRDTTSGTGLGLYIVKHLVDRLGGAIEVDSEVDRGSTFRLFLPLSPPEQTRR